MIGPQKTIYNVANVSTVPTVKEPGVPVDPGNYFWVIDAAVQADIVANNPNSEWIPLMTAAMVPVMNMWWENYDELATQYTDGFEVVIFEGDNVNAVYITDSRVPSNYFTTQLNSCDALLTDEQRQAVEDYSGKTFTY